MEDAHTAILDLDPATPKEARFPDRDEMNEDPPPSLGKKTEAEGEADAAKRAFSGGEGGAAETAAGEDKDGENKKAGSSKYSFFAVYDGHGGQAVAIKAGDRLHWKIIETDEFAKVGFSAL